MNRQGLNWHDDHYCNADDQLLMIEIKPMMETKTMIKAMRKTMNKMMVKNDPDYVEIDGEGQGTIASASWLVANEQTDWWWSQLQ